MDWGGERVGKLFWIGGGLGCLGFRVWKGVGEGWGD